MYHCSSVDVLYSTLHIQYTGIWLFLQNTICVIKILYSKTKLKQKNHQHKLKTYKTFD